TSLPGAPAVRGNGPADFAGRGGGPRDYNRVPHPRALPMATARVRRLAGALRQTYSADQLADRPDAELLARFAAGDDPAAFEAVVALHAELDRLPDKQRLPLLLCYLEGLSRDEAAARLRRTVGAVKADLERGRLVLRGRLSRRGVTLSAGLLAAVTGTHAAA